MLKLAANWNEHLQEDSAFALARIRQIMPLSGRQLLTQCSSSPRVRVNTVAPRELLQLRWQVFCQTMPINVRLLLSAPEEQWDNHD